MRRKIISYLFLSGLVFLIFFFFWQSNLIKIVEKRDYIMVKLIFTKNSYPFKKSFKKGIKIINAIDYLNLGNLDFKKIYMRKNKKWEEVSKDEELFIDCSIKITN